MSELNPFLIAQHQLDVAAEHLGLDPATHELLEMASTGTEDHPARPDGQWERQGLSRLPGSVQHRPGARKGGAPMAPR